MSSLLGRSAAHFDRVVRAYSAELYRYAHYLCRDAHRAEDIVQEALARAWRNWSHVQDEAARRAWLYAIVRNEFLRDAGHAFHRDESLDEAGAAAIADERDFTRGVEIRDLLGRVPQAVLEPLVMQALGGLSCEEVARALGVTVGAAMTRLSRARSMLRQVMEGPRKSRAKEAE